MNLRESIGIALGALRANKLRSFLTLLGTIIGVASVIAVVSFVEGMNRYVSEKLLNAGANVFWVDKFGLITSQEQFEDALKRPDVTLQDADAIRHGAAHVAMVVAQGEDREPLHYRTQAMKGVEVRGRGAGYDVVEDVAIDQGRHLGEWDDHQRALVCVLGPEVSEELFHGLDPIDRVIRIGAESYRVVGVTQAKGKMLGQSQDRFVAIPFRTFQKYKTGRNRSITISIKSVDQAALPVAQQEVRNILRGRRHLAPGRPDNFGLATADTYIELYKTLMGGIFVVTIGVAAISLLVGGIVIMNIMLVSVTERTREIGIRKALGARRRDILAQFLVESTTLSVTGGMVGILIGILLALLVSLVSPLPAAVNVPAVFLGIGMSCLIGIFFGSYPAFRAARLDPIESLRWE